MDKFSKIESLLDAACNFQGNSEEEREKTRDKFRRIETEEENVLRISIDGLVAQLAANMTNKVNETNEKTSYHILLVTSYIRSHYIINELILDGDIIEATTLLRKQLESLTRMNELDKKPLDKLHKLYNKTPNVNNIFRKGAFKDIYAHLSEIAHLATPRAGKVLHIIKSEDLVGVSLYPRYTKLSHGCFDLQMFISLHFLFWLFDKQKSWYPNINTKKYEDILYGSLKIALDIGVIIKSE